MEWEVGRGEAGERSTRLQSCCKLLGRNGLMLALSSELVIQLAVVLKAKVSDMGREAEVSLSWEFRCGKAFIGSQRNTLFHHHPPFQSRMN